MLTGGQARAVRSFDPRLLGARECDAWVAYYRRDWPRVLWASLSLTRHCFALQWPETVFGAWLVLRANQLWAPYPDNDPDGARRRMERFYRLVARRTASDSTRRAPPSSSSSGGGCTERASIPTTPSTMRRSRALSPRRLRA